MELKKSSTWELACPRCHAVLGNLADLGDCAACPACAIHYEQCDGIWRLLSPERAAYFAPFLRDYTRIRDAEGYGYDDDERYRRLPQVDPSDPLAWQWRMRARSFAELRRRVLEPMSAGCDGDTRQGGKEIGRQGDKETRRQGDKERPSRVSCLVSRVLGKRHRNTSGGTCLRVLDMGSGVGWLSHQLARLGHAPCAVDLNLDPRDGLGAAAHYPASWPLLQAEFDRLPLAEDQADVVVFNAALPYSADYRTTLAEALRVLRPGGRIVVMDSPIYRRDASGRQMVAERQAAFERTHGTRSDAIPSIGYLTWDMLGTLGRELGLRWRAYIPWYGWRWALRPWRARLLRQREPSTFALLVAERA